MNFLEIMRCFFWRPIRYAECGSDFYKCMPALKANRFNKGRYDYRPLDFCKTNLNGKAPKRAIRTYAVGKSPIWGEQPMSTKRNKKQSMSILVLVLFVLLVVLLFAI